jgi:hypothetical protein
MAQTKAGKCLPIRAAKVNPLRVLNHKGARAVTCKYLAARVKAKDRVKVRAKA